MRNYLQRSERFNSRIITRHQGNIEGAPGFGGGMFEDIPNPPSNALLVLEDYLCFKDRLECRGGSKRWSDTALPPLLGRTGYSLTKSGTTVTKTVGTNFSAADVGNYIVYDDGEHERISAYIGTTQVTVETSTAHAASTAAWIHGPVNMCKLHSREGRIVLHIDTRLFISEDITLTSWYQVFLAGGTALADSYSTSSELGVYLFIYNSNGIFKMDCSSTGSGSDPCIYYQINTTLGSIGSSNDSSNTYTYRYIVEMSRIAGTDHDRDRTDSTIEHQTAPLSTWNGIDDYFVKQTASAIASGAGKEIAINLDTTLYKYTHVSLYRTLDIGTNGIDPQTGKGNNSELYVWVADIPLERAFRASQSGTTLTATEDIFYAYDVGAFVRSVNGDLKTISAYISATQVTLNDSETIAETSWSVNSANSGRTGSQSVTGNETVGNGTVTRTGGTVFVSADVGQEINWAGQKRSLIVRYIDADNVEVAQSEAISATAFIVDESSDGQIKYYDETTDDSLRRRSAGFSLKNRLMAPLPDCNIGTICGGMMWSAIRGESEVYYSQIPDNEEFYAGFYRPSGSGAQIDNLPDAIQTISEFPDRVVFYCNQSTWFISTNDYFSVTTPQIGEVIIVATGHWPISNIGLNDYGSNHRIGGVEVSDIQQTLGDIMYCSDGTVRICNGTTFTPDLSINRIRKTLFGHAIRSAAAYDSINGYTLWRSDDTINDTTHGYVYGVEPVTQGIGWYKYLNGDPIYPFAYIGGIVVIDSNGFFRSLVLDSRDGFFYDISTRDGPTGSGLSKLWKDKVGTDGSGGTDVDPAVEFIPERGTEEQYVLEHKLSKIFTRPYSKSDGYPSGLAFTMKIYEDVETSVTAQAASVTRDNDVKFDKKATGNQLRIRVESNKGDHIITGRWNSFLTKDKAVSASNRTSAELGYQKSLANTLLHVTAYKGNSVIDRYDGDVVEASPTLTTGPDGYSDSGITVGTTLTTQSVTVTSGTLLIWADGAITVTIGGSSVSLSTHGSVGSFALYYASITGSGVIVVGGAESSIVMCDLRVINEALSAAARTYYYDDVNTNYGKVVFPR